MVRVTCGVIAGLMLVAPQQTAFRSSIDLVEVYATVIDRAGGLVTDLTLADFEVLEDGRSQAVVLFAPGTQPITMAVMVDESPSLFDASARIRQAVDTLAYNLLPGDRVTIGAFSHIVRMSPAFRTSFARLAEDLDIGRPRFPAGTALWDALAAAMTALGEFSGRRVVLVLTDAEDNCSQVEPDEVLAQAERRGALVYTIGLKGERGLHADELRDLSRDSGGDYVELKADDDVIGRVKRVVDELHHQYLLAFEPTALDGKKRQLTVKVKRSGLTVRARRSYVAGGGQRW